MTKKFKMTKLEKLQSRRKLDQKINGSKRHIWF